MMTYEFWWSTTETNKATFTANSLEEAKALLASVDNKELLFDDLPNFESRNKGLEIQIDDITDSYEI